MIKNSIQYDQWRLDSGLDLQDCCDECGSVGDDLQSVEDWDGENFLCEKCLEHEEWDND